MTRRMPAELEPHERTLMAWPCRASMWGEQLAAARAEYAGVANAIAAFEPVTMVCADDAQAAAAGAALSAAVDVMTIPIDDSWLRDSGPCFVFEDGEDGRTRRAVHFGFNAWGEKFPPWDADAAVGAALGRLVGDPVDEAGFVLEGGSIAVDGTGTLVTTEQCLLNRNRNPALGREEIEAGLREYLGAERIVWLGQGLAEDRDTDGHVDMIAAFTAPGALLLQSAPEGDVNHEAMTENARRARAEGLEVEDFPLLARFELGGEPVGLSYLNLYVCNGGVIVPSADAPNDAEALERIAAAFPGRDVVGAAARTIAYGGGGPHCITQQVPACS
jgi:agmatine deiminase